MAIQNKYTIKGASIIWLVCLGDFGNLDMLKQILAGKVGSI